MFNDRELELLSRAVSVSLLILEHESRPQTKEFIALKQKLKELKRAPYNNPRQVVVEGLS